MSLLALLSALPVFESFLIILQEGMIKCLLNINQQSFHGLWNLAQISTRGVAAKKFLDSLKVVFQLALPCVQLFAFLQQAPFGPSVGEIKSTMKGNKQIFFS